MFMCKLYCVMIRAIAENLDLEKITYFMHVYKCTRVCIPS